MPQPPLLTPDDSESFVIIDEDAADSALPDAAQARATGLDGATSEAGKPDVPDAAAAPSPLILSALQAYARSRVEAGDACPALVALGLDIPDLVAAYGLGFLPADYGHALPRDAKQALRGHRCANAVLFPAYDAAGVIVDLLVQRVHSTAPAQVSLGPAPTGLLAPNIARGYPELIVTDNVRWLARLFREGHRNVALLRGPRDARHNATRLLTCGVQQITLRARRGADEIAGVLKVAGLAVTIIREPVEDAHGGVTRAVTSPGAVSPNERLTNTAPVVPTMESASSAPVTRAGLTLITHECTAEVALFEAGPIRYTVNIREDDATIRHVLIRCGGKTSESDCDLANPVQRQRIAGNVGLRFGQPAALIETHLAALLPAVLAHETALHEIPAVAISPADRAAGLALLEAPNLLESIGADLTAMGWLGEDKAKRILYLAGISRLLPQPTWAVYQASAGAAPWQGVGCIMALTPPEVRTVFHRLTGSTLAQADRASLRHRLVIVDQAEALRPEAALALRVLRERGGIGWGTAAPGSSGAGSEARGPVAVLAAATGPLDVRCRDVFLTITADESAGQTAAILADQRRRSGASGSKHQDTASIIARHHAAHRLLERLPVRIPFADRIIFPASRLRHRDEQAWFLGLVAASALLHQRQRPREDGVVLASEADFTAVVHCTAGLLGGEGGSISDAARCLLSLLYEKKLVSFTMADLSGLLPDWTRYTFRAALTDLQDFGHIDSPNGGRGRRRSYRLAVRAAGAAAIPGGIRLREATAAHVESADAAAAEVHSGSVGELARVGETGVANFISRPTGT